MADFLAPPDVAKTLVAVGEKKAALSVSKMFVLGILAGVFIGFAAHLATTVATGPLDYFGFKKFMVGAVFSVGLMLVIIPGSELWTGNNLMTVALMQRSISAGGLLRNWIVVYLGNLVGSLLLAFIVAKSSGLLDGAVGGTAISIAAGKTAAAEGHNYAFFYRGIGCNWLVCLAVMMAVAAQDISGKIFGIFFPIMAFVTSGFEHCVANMYFIPAGIFAKGFEQARAASGLSAEALEGLHWGSMWTQNLVSVTLGNFVGGALLTGVVYWWIFVRQPKTPAAPQQ
ncbi:MAG: formate/nitrite transporter family protein [Candidatus Hydrogenedentota bacterium]